MGTRVVREEHFYLGHVCDAGRFLPLLGFGIPTAGNSLLSLLWLCSQVSHRVTLLLGVEKTRLQELGIRVRVKSFSALDAKFTALNHVQ